MSATNTKRTIDEPAVRALLTGLVRSGRRYYRVNVDTGFHTQVLARAELMKLTSQVTATRLLREAVSAGLITEENIDLAQESHHRAAAKEGVAAVVSNNDSEDEDEEGDESGSRATSKLPLGLSDIPKGELDRYELVKTGSGFWGYYDREHYREVILSRDKEAVLEEIYALRRNANKLPFAWPTAQSIS